MNGERLDILKTVINNFINDQSIPNATRQEILNAYKAFVNSWNSDAELRKEALELIKVIWEDICDENGEYQESRNATQVVGRRRRYRGYGNRYWRQPWWWNSWYNYWTPYYYWSPYYYGGYAVVGRSAVYRVPDMQNAINNVLGGITLQNAKMNCVNGDCNISAKVHFTK